MAVLLLTMIASAVAVFIRIQAWLNDPRRAEFNERWFAQFEDQLKAKYEDESLRWRYQGLSSHFQRQEFEKR
jgi:hypothetical protein